MYILIKKIKIKKQMKIILAAQYFEIFKFHGQAKFYDQLHLSSFRPGILYSRLPKIHKMSIPLRLILSSIGTCGYKITKFLVPILEPITSNQFTVLDSFSFATEISKFKDSKSATNMSWQALIFSVFSPISL